MICRTYDAREALSSVDVWTHLHIKGDLRSASLEILDRSSVAIHASILFGYSVGTLHSQQVAGSNKGRCKSRSGSRGYQSDTSIYCSLQHLLLTKSHIAEGKRSISCKIRFTNSVREP